MAQVKKIVLEINKKQIELSLDEAKELKCILADLFVNEAAVIREPAYIPWYVRQYPIWKYEPSTTSDTIYLSTNSTA